MARSGPTTIRPQHIVPGRQLATVRNGSGAIVTGKILSLVDTDGQSLVQLDCAAGAPTLVGLEEVIDLLHALESDCHQYCSHACATVRAQWAHSTGAPDPTRTLPEPDVFPRTEQDGSYGYTGFQSS
ncbi:hypothetical protein ABT263_29380 [Kitasatospora sp. NPDC001603]|uniref:hypothetical protein n=1 Tax=Kitasatospora sp. NPDC001603 TaxID=3154388 RepID=UPI00331B0397